MRKSEEISNGRKILEALWRFEQGHCPVGSDNAECPLNCDGLTKAIHKRLGGGEDFTKRRVDTLANDSRATRDTLSKVERAYRLPGRYLSDCEIVALADCLKTALHDDEHPSSRDAAPSLGIITRAGETPAQDLAHDISFDPDRTSNAPNLNVHITATLDAMESAGWVWSIGELWLEGILPPNSEIGWRAPDDGYPDMDEVTIENESRGKAWKVVLRPKNRTHLPLGQLLRNWFAGQLVNPSPSETVEVRMTIPRWITTAKREGRFEENVRTLGEPDEAARGAVVNALFVEAIQDHPSDTVDKKILSTETLHIVEIEDE